MGIAGAAAQEYVQALKAIWSAWETGERLNYEGRHYQFTLMTPFFSPDQRIPSATGFTAAVNAYNCQVAGEVADGLMLHRLTSPDYVRDVVRPALTRGAERAAATQARSRSAVVDSSSPVQTRRL